MQRAIRTVRDQRYGRARPDSGNVTELSITGHTRTALRCTTIEFNSAPCSEGSVHTLTG
jgi:hypothetical protein